MVEARGLVKRYGATAAVNDLSFTIRPGLVTGFLVEKHIANIFDKLGLAPDDNDNRRVIAALRYLDS